MGIFETEVPGYAKPIDADSSSFPYESAAIVNNWGSLAGMILVKETLRKIEDCLGDTGRMSELAETWLDASAPIEDARNGILSTKGDLAAYWEGRAADSFQSYIEHVISIMNDTSKTFVEMSQLVVGLRELVTGTYISGISLIGTCAARLIEAAGNAAMNWYKLWGAVAGGILEALAGFIDATTELINNALRTMDRYARTALDIKRHAISMQVPDPMPKSATEPGNWKVSPQ
ncbi:WXG100 family type VII secretion target [Actinoalloteichus sp. GBA129-24]|uniref:WXG100 family type VII secretion target n=1 Tax=Actinoalloteichus sp. GBA129-24 TaxID=1612551 RepID=UPI000950B523|nr:hypothetical protein [Actinoalloteichus sp. GBA129-24]APU22102.1 hypothetical protein UA75_20565 [Actinoalloteichus sp. GBA129-24]